MKTKAMPLLATLIFAANVAVADETGSEQTNSEPSMDVRYGVRAGVNFSSMSSLGNVLGWQIGGAADIPLKQIKMGTKYGLINIQPELMFVSKGGEASFFLIRGTEVSAYYLELPVSGSFKFIVSPNFAVRADIGPYFAFGLFGKWKSYGYSGDTFSSNGVSRLDLGLHYGVAIEFYENFYFALANSTGVTSDNVDSFYSTFGYNF